ncbi:MAG: DNA translocase FtsK [Clostridiaceae bacterium]|nr:DNA translocase FtsK [Clostridiaceae bacterium]
MAVAEKTAGNKKITSKGAGTAAKRGGSGQTKRTSSGTKASRTKNTASKSASSGKKRTVQKTAAARAKSVEELNQYKDRQAFEFGITIFALGILSVIWYLSYFQLAGNAGIVLGGLTFGIFGWFAWILPLAVLTCVVFCGVNRGDRRVFRRVGGFIGIVLSLLGLSDLIFRQQIITEYYTSNHVMHREYFECMFLTCEDVVGRGKWNGGLLGRAVANVFSVMIGRVGACIILFALLLLFLYIFYGVEFMGILRKRNAYRQEMSEIYQEVSKEEDYKEPSYRVFSSDHASAHTGKRDVFVPEAGRGPKRGEGVSLQKVPKQQMFDLQKINQRLDQMEESVGSMSRQESPVSAGKTQKTKTPAASAAEETKAEDVRESKKPGKQSAEGAERPENADVVLQNDRQDTMDEIPIYRNELNQKFRKNRESLKEYPVVDAEHPDRVVADGKMHGISPVSAEETTEVLEAITAAPSAFDTFQQTASKKSPVEHTNGKTQEKNVLEPADIGLADMEPQGEGAVAKPAGAQSTAEPAKAAGPDSTAAPAKGAEPDSTAKPAKAAEPDSTAKPAKAAAPEAVSQPDKPYEFPPIDLLSLPPAEQGSISDEQLRLTASKLQDTLQSFNVNVKMGAVTCGPTVTRYELLPEQGVRVNKITNLADDLKLSLAASSIRIEAPIPGKAAVGIEVPNPSASAVFFRELLEGDIFQKTKSPLTFAVGKDIAGKIIMADIAKMPHLLIAGATGSGKSVCINTLIMSILYKADPKDVKLIMIDPKVVELSVYNGIPHLFCPVVTDPKEAAAALNWAVREMMERYNKFKELGVRNIAGYNEKINKVEDAAAAGYEKMPYLVVIVDEFADLMMVASKEVEDAVCRLAQLARAAGIHLVLATQRPSVNVITGVIKANIPSRIAFSVSSAIDSRTILDKGGAEKLLGKGDMLFFPSGYSEPVRVQGALVADNEVSDVVDFLCNTNETPEYNHAVTEVVEQEKEAALPEEKKAKSEYDDYFEDAGRFVIESERAAAGQLQRHFSIGFNRAGRIIDQLHKAGVVGPAEGTKPRRVLMTMEQFEAMLHGENTVSDAEMEAMSKEMDEAVVTME